MTNKKAPKRLRVMMSAYACQPGRGSEPGVGWNLAKAMTERHDVWVLTRADNRPAIEAELVKRPVPNLNFLYYELPRWASWWKRGDLGVQAHYYLWQLGATKIARLAHAKMNFDIAHHVTYTKYWAPAGVGFVECPFVWGPVGGGESMPSKFMNTLSLYGRFYEISRLIARWIGEHDPIVRSTAKRASVGIATTFETENRMRHISKHRVKTLSSIAVSKDEFDVLAKITKNIQTRGHTFLAIGRLLGWKGYQLALRAFAQAQIPGSNFIILGTGPEQRNLEGLAKNLEIDKQVKFISEVSRDDVLRLLSDSKIFIHPSLHESGGMVILEAMAAGLPVICLDIGGPAVHVNSRVGRKIAAINPDQAINDLSKAMQDLALDPDLRRQLGEAARQHVALEFTWERKAEQLAQVYEQVLSEGRNPEHIAEALDSLYQE